MNKIYKIILLILSMTILTGAAISTSAEKINEKNQVINGTINGTLSNAEMAILSWPPWDSGSAVQSTNTNNIYMKIDHLPLTEWTDIEGYYNQLNYFQYPITVKLVNGTNYPIKYKNIYVYIDEYETWWEGGWFSCNCWKYRYITSYSKTKSTGSSGNAEFLFSLPYKGYNRVMYRTTIYYWTNTNDYAYYKKNVRAAWYINTATSFDPSKMENIEYRRNI